MKTKKFSKKLILNKKTVADLNNKKMKDVIGGVHTRFECTWGTCIFTGPCLSVNPPIICKDGC